MRIEHRRSAGRVTAIIALLAAVGLAATASWYWWPASVRTAPVRKTSVTGTGDFPVGNVPKVEPARYLEVSPETARSINNAHPFVTAGNVPATPFVFTGSPADRSRAAACLTAAVYYEAGNDPVGMQAVAQVVLNRVRHPAFPKTVCGAVFQGAERTTGCQFTFTCDGALNRPITSQVWKLARQVADGALNGFVFRYVGLATHYHTDWVVPYWSPTMDKVAQVHTHLFFRWRGAWGTAAAFRGSWKGPEVVDRRIAALVDKETDPQIDNASLALGGPGDTANNASGATFASSSSPLPPIDLGPNRLRLSDTNQNLFGLELAQGAFPGSYAVLANKICSGRAPCRVAGWLDAASVPANIDRNGAWTQGASFVFEKTAAGDQRVRWNCKQIPRSNSEQCLPG